MYLICSIFYFTHLHTHAHTHTHTHTHTRTHIHKHTYTSILCLSYPYRSSSMGAQRSQYSRHMSPTLQMSNKPSAITEIVVDTTKGTLYFLFSHCLKSFNHESDIPCCLLCPTDISGETKPLRIFRPSKICICNPKMFYLL